MALESASVIIPEINDFLSYFDIVGSLFLRVGWENALVVSLESVLMLVEELPLSVCILRLDLIGFLESFDHSLLLLLEGIVDLALSLVWVKLEHGEGVLQEIELNPGIEGSVCIEAGGLVDLKQPGLRFLVENDIEA